MTLGGDHVHGVLQRTDDGGKVFPHGIKAAGADIVAYRAPVLPGCVMYAKRTVFDLILPRVMADDEIKAEEIAALGEGGLCLNCPVCTFPNCGFGKGY